MRSQASSATYHSRRSSPQPSRRRGARSRSRSCPGRSGRRDNGGGAASFATSLPVTTRTTPGSASAFAVPDRDDACVRVRAAVERHVEAYPEADVVEVASSGREGSAIPRRGSGSCRASDAGVARRGVRGGLRGVRILLGDAHAGPSWRTSSGGVGETGSSRGGADRVDDVLVARHRQTTPSVSPPICSSIPAYPWQG